MHRLSPPIQSLRRTIPACGLAVALTSTALASKPNILFVTVDDLRPEFGAYGQTAVKSPNLDRLANMSLRFDHAYVQQAMCGPSRAAVLSGRRPGSTRLFENSDHVTKAFPDLVTMPQFFQKNGYFTMLAGKVYHNEDDDAAAWDWRAQTKRFNWADPDTVAEYNRLYKEAGEKGLTGWRRFNYAAGPSVEAAEVKDDAYEDGVIANEAVEALRERIYGDKPFFLAVGFKKPHLPFCAPKKYWDLYDRESIPLPYDKSPEGAPKWSLEVFSELRAYSDIPDDGKISEEKIRELIHGYWACVSYMDAQLGRLLDELDRQGLMKNTIIVLWGDHGWKLGEHGHWVKHSNHELDTRAPLLIRLPGQSEGGSTEALAEMVDIYPTLAELAGLTPPDHLEGTSLVPVLENPSRKWKSAAFSEYNRDWWKVHGNAVTDGRFRYTAWRSQETGEIKAEELYDHQETSLSLRNLVEDPAYAADLARMRGLMEQGWTGVRSTMANNNPTQP